MNVTNFTQNFSRIVKLIGSTPFIILVSLPSLVFIGFNVYFTSNIVTLIIQSLELSGLFGKIVRGFVYLSTTLLIMYPLLETLFKTTGGQITKTEEKYLILFDRVAIGLLLSVSMLYLSCWIGVIGNGIQVDITVPKQVLNKVESVINLFFTVEEVKGKREITFIEGVIGLLVFGFIYFTDKAAGICLITLKDILFPDMTEAKKGNDKINNKADESLMAEFKSRRDEIKELLNNDEIKQKDYNKANGLIGNLRGFPQRAYEDKNKEYMTKELKELSALYSSKESSVVK